MDVEKNAGIAENGSTGADSSNDGKSPPRTHMIDPTDPGEADVVKIRQKYGVLRRLRDAETWLDRKLKFEAMGVERIPDEKRRPPQKLNVSSKQSASASSDVDSAARCATLRPPIGPNLT